VGALVVLVAVQLSVLGLYFPPVLSWMLASCPPPDDHFTATPHCRVVLSTSGRVGGAGGRSGIRDGIVSAAGVEIDAKTDSTPDDHFTASPHCRVIGSPSGRVGRAGGRPAIRAGVISPA
jgi:hypothetical protein